MSNAHFLSKFDADTKLRSYASAIDVLNIFAVWTFFGDDFAHICDKKFGLAVAAVSDRRSSIGDRRYNFVPPFVAAVSDRRSSIGDRRYNLRRPA